jgi:hypothetical protein
MKILDSQNYTPLIKTNIILSSLSLLGCLIIILLYCFRAKLRSFVFSLVFFLSISELLNSIANLLSIDKLNNGDVNGALCHIQSIVLIYTDFCTLTWVLIISYTIHDLMCNFNQEIVERKNIFIGLGFTFPAVFAIVAAILTLGDDTSPMFNECWCYISVDRQQTFLIVTYVFYWLIIVINFFIILKVIRFLRRNCDSDDVHCHRIRSMCQRLYLYPIITTICFTFATIHRFYQIFGLKPDVDGDNDPSTEQLRVEVILYLLHGMFITFRGFLYFIVYGFDEKVKKELIMIFGRFCKKRQRYVSLNI